ncbi:helicase, partial [Bifidobacteriaceae bacterium WP022]
HNWDLLQNSLHNAQSKAYFESQILVDNSRIDGSSNDLMPLSLDACYLLCVADVARFIDDDSNVRNDSTVLQILQNMAPRNPHVASFVKLWKNVQILASRMHNNPDLSSAQYALGEAWNICHVAERWQRMSLQHDSEGYRANDRLDAAMRLFDYVSSYVSSDISSMNTFDDTFRQENVVSIADFIAQVRGMEIEADSLAKVAPVPDAVTLTTPAGSVGKHWNLVWMPTLQQRVWPNLASRSTMFGAESLANIILHSKISASKLTVNASLLSNNDKSAVFASEQRSFLLAITRATERLYISAQYSDSAVPSDFLYYYLPERYYNNENSRTPFTEFTTPFAGLDMDARGLVCAARSQILRASSMKEEFGNSVGNADSADSASSSDIANSSNSENSKSRNAIIDAAQTLQLLKENGVFCADPFEWDFMSDVDDYVDKKSSVEKDNEKNNEKAGSAKKASSVVSLSPSAVDSLWACPVCGLLNRQLLGPQPGSAATYFGTLIHETARWASENQHYDMPETEVDETETANNSADYSPYSPLVRRSNAIANLMEKYYLSIAPELADIRDSKEHYSALAREKNIKRALHAIAQYFVTSYDQSTYALNSKKSENGILESLTKSEKSLESSIGRLQQA